MRYITLTTVANGFPSAPSASHGAERPHNSPPRQTYHGPSDGQLHQLEIQLSDGLPGHVTDANLRLAMGTSTDHWSSAHVMG